MVYKQNYVNFREYIDPIRDMSPKLESLKRSFRTTLNQYSAGSNVHPDNITCENGDPNSIRRYQALRDFSLYNTKANLIGEYMDLVKQYGLIVLFSQIFPPAAILSFVCNFIQMKS